MNGVRIADLKAHLSAHLREVRRGRTIVVLDRETPIARLVPYDGSPGALRVRHPRGKARLRDVPLPPPLRLDLDIVELLLQDREGGR